MISQKALSHNNEALETLMGDHWLIKNGIWTERAADNLLGYAYMQPGVEKVNLEIDTQESANKSPKITYKIKLEKSFYRKYFKIKELNNKPSLFNKLKMLYLMKQGIPSAGSIESTIKICASEIVPKNYSIEILFEN